MLLILIKNELIKIFKKAKTWIVFILFLLIIGISIFAQFNQDKNIRMWNSPEKMLERAKSDLEYNNNQLNDKDTEKNPDYVQYLQDKKVELQETIKRYEEEIKSGVDEDTWKIELDNNIKDMEQTIEEYKNYNDEWSKTYKLQAEKDLEMYKYLKENNIKPLYGWEYEAYGYMKNLMQFLGISTLLCGIAVFMSDIVSGECTPATLKFLLIQPVTRGKVLLAKFIAVTLTVLIMILGGELIGFSIVNLTSNIGGSSYPIEIGIVFNKVVNSEGIAELVQVVGSGYMVTNLEMLIKAILLQGLFIITACAFIFMISTLIKSSMITMAISVIVTVFLTIATMSFESLKNIAHLFFVNYGDTISLLTGSSAIMYKNVNMTIANGVIVMLVTAITSYLIAYFNFKNKDILI